MIKWVERGVLLAAILSMLFVWPYGGIREDKKDSSLSEDYGYTEPLQVGEYASQYFVAETDFLKTLEYCREIDLKKWQKRPLRRKLAQAVLNFFAPLL